MFMGKKVLIVGGVAGGATAAARMRRLDEEAEIVLFERGEYISFANCGLPYHIGNVISDREKLLVVTPQDLKEMLNIDSRINNEVIKIEGLANSNGKKWISLSLLNQGINELTCTAKDVTRHAQPAKRLYTLTSEEDLQVKALQAQIDTIIDAAKARYVARPNLDVDASKLSLEERQALAEQIKKYFNL
jgi:choline dehydrogenase-like flavoprotein